MIREMAQSDKTAFLEMAKIFFSSDAVAHKVESHLLEKIFDDAVGYSPYIRGLIIEDKKQPVGFALLAFSYSTEAVGHTVLLEDLYVSETFRGKGIGSKVVKFIEKEYPEVRRFRLEVAKENTKAINLYKRLGYEALEYVQMVKEV